MRILWIAIFIGGGILEIFTEYLANIHDSQHHARTKEILDWVIHKFPSLEPKMAWNQPMFTDHGTYIIGFSISKKHLSISPEQFGMEHFVEEISKVGYGQSKMLFRIQWNEAVDFSLLERIINFNCIDKKQCATFWRK